MFKYSMIMMSLLAVTNSVSIYKFNYTGNSDLIGGYISTKFGCCRDNQTQCMTQNCSDCNMSKISFISLPKPAISNDIKFISIPDIEYGMKILIDVKIVKIIITIKSTLPKFSGMILKGFKIGSVNFTTI